AFLERKWGVWFAMGGTGAIVDALVALFQRLGGHMQLSSEVEQIIVKSGRVDGVQIKHGPLIPARMVVSNGDAPWTYKHLIAAEARKKYTDRRIDKMRYSMSLVVSYFGTKKLYPELAHHTILLGPRYRELLDDIFDKKILAPDFSLYLHAPTRTDPSLAPPGCGAYYVLAPVPHLGRAPVDWGVTAPGYAHKILAALEGLMPGLRRHVVTQRWLTPVDFRDQLAAHHGAAFSLAPLLGQSAWFRPHNRDPRIPGLYLVGAGTHPGAGVPGVVNSGKATARLVIEDLLGARS
ncbi:MAG TPA: phytoene desaturase family protein, partial [Polyangiaceae bacterium]|nr:phytoene desaturase family protein [Polyangiaceae bacterium]